MSQYFENFKKEANKLHNFKFDYSKFEYKDTKTPSTIICPIHGEFTQRTDYHLREGCAGCPKCETTLRFEQFKSRANEVHNSKFDYSKFEYVNQKTPSIIICPLHGEFTQKPDHHIRVNAKGCPKCWNILKAENAKANYNPLMNVTSQETFLKQAHSKFGSRLIYDLTNYTGLMGAEISITCPEHGEFKKTPHDLLATAYGCTLCANLNRAVNKTHNYDDLLNQLKDIYGDKYSYPDVNRDNYKNKRSIIQVVCPQHGLFLKKTQKLLCGQECFECTVEKLVAEGVLVGGYTYELFRKKPELKTVSAYLYYLYIGDYYKIGITRKTVESRVRSLKSLSGRDVEIIFTLKMPLYEAYKREQELLTQFKDYRINTSYSTEFFKVDITKLKGFKL